LLGKIGFGIKCHSYSDDGMGHKIDTNDETIGISYLIVFVLGSVIRNLD
jgi:hypothetical protein